MVESLFDRCSSINGNVSVAITRMEWLEQRNLVRSFSVNWFISTRQGSTFS